MAMAVPVAKSGAIVVPGETRIPKLSHWGCCNVARTDLVRKSSIRKASGGCLVVAPRAYRTRDDDDEPQDRPSWRPLKPVEERYNIRVEKNITPERAEELGVWRWSKWETGRCAYSREWRVDQEVYIVKGAVKVVPDQGEGVAWFYAGDFVRFPKWFAADLSFDGPYEERYRYRAYGDD